MAGTSREVISIALKALYVGKTVFKISLMLFLKAVLFVKFSKQETGLTINGTSRLLKKRLVC